MTKIKCIHCGSENTNKAGFTKNRKQRYYCRDCRRFSRENPVKPENTSKKKVSRQKNLPSKSHLMVKNPRAGKKFHRIFDKRLYKLSLSYFIGSQFTQLSKPLFWEGSNRPNPAFSLRRNRIHHES